MVKTNKSQIYEVEVGPFFIRASNKTNVEDIMWTNYGVEYSQIRKIKVSNKNQEIADNE